MLADLTETGGFWQLVERAEIEVPSTVLYIVVNAQAVGEHGWVQREGAPTLGDLLGAVTSVGMYRYNFETIELLREAAANWSRQAAKRGHRLDTHVSEVAFDDLGDAEERDYFNNVATSFDLDDETIDRLIEVGGRLLRESPDFQQFLGSVK